VLRRGGGVGLVLRRGGGVGLRLAGVGLLSLRGGGVALLLLRNAVGLLGTLVDFSSLEHFAGILTG